MAKADLKAASIIAPFPPPVGGIASLALWLKHQLGARNDLYFAPLGAKSGASGLGRNITNLGVAWRAISQTKKAGVVLAFSSAGFSFYEKIVWMVLAGLRGRTPALVMVDGNFPAWWARRTQITKFAVKSLIKAFKIKIVGQSDQWSSFYTSLFDLPGSATIGATAQKDFFDLALRRHDPKYGADRSKITLLFAGWMIREKGVDDLLQALKLMTFKDLPIEVSFVGPTFENQVDWARHSADLNISQTLHFTGRIEDRTVLLDHFLTADIFVLPSHAEGFSVALVEAVASGLPTIATDVGGARDTIIEGKTGFVIPVRDPAALAAALDRLCKDPDLRHSMSFAAASFAKDAFSETAALEKYCAVLGLKRTD